MRFNVQRMSVMLVIIRTVNRKNMDQIRKKFIKIFKQVDFKTEIKANLKSVDVSDVTFNLTNGTFQYFLNTSTNHHPQVKQP